MHAGLFDEGTIVITDNQVKGRGQRGTEWLANPGENLTFSVILTPHFLPISHQFLLSQTVALAVRDFVGKYVVDTKVKWPNDILANGKKVCGILIENAIQGSKIVSSVAGIGLNVNQILFENPYATSISNETGRQISLQEAFENLVLVIESYYFKLKTADGQDQIRAAYLNHLYGYKKTVRFKYADRTLEGTVDHITPQGKLVLQLLSEPGQIEVGLKEIEWLWD
ncbi:biotin--[acetyl-CoA-carboxylase] ligase [Dyadobacter sp. CY326]|nr:biotin--[acetyl-CoA-carboxylase] ligase [Dyadobacter sp. CY326]